MENTFGFTLRVALLAITGEVIGDAFTDALHRGHFARTSTKPLMLCIAAILLVPA